MIAVDTSSLVAFLDGEDAPDTEMVALALRDLSLVLPPVVITETLSDPAAKGVVEDFLREITVLEITGGFWFRAAGLRRTISGLKLKAKLGDALVAQACIDHKVPLITRDKDFRHYAKHCGLKLYAEGEAGKGKRP